MHPSVRDRRSPLFGGASAAAQGEYDPEATERENDRNIADVGDRVSLLKSITQGIQDEVKTQNGVLDGMGIDMSGTKDMLSGTVGRLTKVMEDKSNKKMLYTVGAIVVFFLVLYFLFR
mmetsp:Transcript_4522/g.11309  ORF Transcript_4522/g.11309 Transcript_4522/m.11309 type:complete len:118 (+) Transcript_4522:179-532(+)